jgi:hypothetical protein
METTDSGDDDNEYTILDKLLDDQSLIESTIKDETTDPALVNTLTELEQPVENPIIPETCDTKDGNIDGAISASSEELCTALSTLPQTDTLPIIDTLPPTETCGNGIDDNNDGVIDEEQCTTPTTLPPTETCGNGIDDNNDGVIDEEQCTTPTTLPPTETCGNGIDDNNDGVIDEEQCTPPVSEICGNGIDDNNDGVIDEEQCIVPPAEICDNQIDDDVDGKIDAQDEDCPIVEPTVVIESAIDEEGELLSPGDLIVPQKVTFTFSAQASETTQNNEQDSAQDYEFECALDDESFSSCNSPITYDLDKGKHDFVVKVVS